MTRREIPKMAHCPAPSRGGGPADRGGISLPCVGGAGLPRHRNGGGGRRLSGAGAALDVQPVPDGGYGQGRSPCAAGAGGRREDRRVRRLRRGRHHRHLYSGGLPPEPGRRRAALYPPPHRGRLRPELRRHRGAVPQGHKASHHGGLRHHRRGGGGLRQLPGYGRGHHRPPRVQGDAAPRRSGGGPPPARLPLPFQASGGLRRGTEAGAGAGRP